MVKMLLAMFFAGLCLPTSQAASLKADGDVVAQDEVKKIELTLAQTLVKGDWEKYAAYLAEDYSCINDKGQVQGKATLVEGLRAGKATLLNVLPEELAVRVYGDTAVLTGHLSVLARQNGKVTTSFFRYTDVFVRRAGEWSSVAVQATQVKE